MSYTNNMEFKVNLLPNDNAGGDLGSSSKKWNNIYGELVGNASTSTTLKTSRTLYIGNAGTSSGVSFNGSGNVTIPLDSVKESYLTWGGKALSGNVTPVDAGCLDEVGHNKLAFLPGSCITIEYTTDGGTTWVDYGYNDSQKTSMVTLSGPWAVVGKGLLSAKDGTLTNDNVANVKLRIKISSRDSDGNSKIYTYLQKILVNISTSGAGNCKVKIERRTVGDYNNNNDNWVETGTYSISGWSGWNSLPYLNTFGGSSSQTTNPSADIRLTFWGESVNTTYNSCLQVGDIRFIGTTNWTTPSEMSRVGHIYECDVNQNTTFPKNIYPKVNNAYTLGSSSYKWNNIYSTTFTGNATSSDKVNHTLTIGTYTFNGSADVTIPIYNGSTS